MSGIGIQPAGSTSAGYGTSDGANEFGGAFLRDERTSAVLGARKVDPRTRDFVLDDDGRTLGMVDVQHMVQMAVHTEYNTSAVRGLGNRLSSIDRVTGNFEQRALDVLTEAVGPLVRAGYVRVLGFTSFRAGDDRNGMKRGTVYGRFRWYDVTARRERETEVG